MKIRVKTEQLVRASDEASKWIAAVSRDFDDIRKIVQNSSSYWEGDGQEAYERSYMGRLENIESALKAFQGNVSALLQIAGIYEAAEEQNVDHSEALPTDVIL